jgi:precorrin-6B methylase 2
MYYNHQTIWSELLPSLTWSRNWHEKEDNEVLCKYAEKVNNGHILEIGSAEGQSSISMLLANDSVYCVVVDPFITTNLLTNIKAMGLGKRVIILPATSEEVFLPPMGYELVFIDGIHTYDMVKHDLNKFSKTGAKWIILHDINKEEIAKAVAEFLLKGDYETEYLGDNIQVLSKIKIDRK